MKMASCDTKSLLIYFREGMSVHTLLLGTLVPHFREYYSGFEILLDGYTVNHFGENV